MVLVVRTWRLGGHSDKTKQSIIIATFFTTDYWNHIGMISFLIGTSLFGQKKHMGQFVIYEIQPFN